MPHRRLHPGRPFLVLGLVLGAWLVVPTIVKRFLRISFFELQAPVSLSASYVRDLQDYWSLRTRSTNELIAAGRDLVRLNASYEATLQQSESLRQQVTRLEALLRLPAVGGYRSEVARVARRDFNGWWQRLTVRKGRNYGITVGSPVIFSGGIVGKVAEVNATLSVIDLISSPGVRIAATLDGDTRPLSYQGGENPAFGPAVGIAEYVPTDASASPTSPKRLVTSGLGGVFPPGLTIGEIVRLETSTDGLFKTGEVRLDPRLTELNEVTILVPLSPN
ncbi:MAG TPA: rod shape-determining protein MreC [Opitutaceae bacterium]|nr:rod shape-determining protein MreC [Opitutaceae bacterium]